MKTLLTLALLLMAGSVRAQDTTVLNDVFVIGYSFKQPAADIGFGLIDATPAELNWGALIDGGIGFSGFSSQAGSKSDDYLLRGSLLMKPDDNVIFGAGLGVEFAKSQIKILDGDRSEWNSAVIWSGRAGIMFNEYGAFFQLGGPLSHASISIIGVDLLYVGF